MGTIPDFTLPSNPSVTVRLREATVSDAIDFADIDLNQEEKATTLFLERLQAKETYTDPRTWTGEDRRLALYWYWLHTVKETDLPMTFECQHCGETHTMLVDMRAVAEGYTAIKGRAERDVEWAGPEGNFTVHPLTGADMEEIEMLRLKYLDAKKKGGDECGPARFLASRLRLLRVLRCVTFAGLSGENEEAKRKEQEKRLLAMKAAEMSVFAAKVFDALADMEHGLSCEYDEGRILLSTPPIPCPNAEGGEAATTALRFPFRTLDYIPGV